MDTWIARTLPWLALAGCLIEFVLVDELRAGRAGRARLAAAFGVALMVAAGAVSALTSTPAADLFWSAAPPLLFLVLASLVRTGFRPLKGPEPHVLFTASDIRDARAAAAAPSDSGPWVLAWDFAYTLTVGAVWLATLLPAITRLG